MRDQLEATAIHEAAHAVAYVGHGLPFRYVTIRARHDIGRVAPYGPRRVDSFALAIITAAGPIAERIAYPAVRWQPVADELAETEDFLEAEGDFGAEIAGDFGQFVRLIPGRDNQLVMWEAAERIVMSAWPHIEAVAAALLASPRALTGREVARLTDRVSARAPAA